MDTTFRPDRAGAALIAAAAIMFGSVLAGCSRETPPPGEFRGTPLERPLAKVDFALEDTDGRRFHFARSTRGMLTFLFFGYTNCPDVCPVHMAALGEVIDRLPFEARNRIAVVFVSTDPDRDSAARIREWLDSFGPSFIGLRGDIAEVNRIQEAYGLAPAAKGIDDGRGGYVVGHAAQILAFTPDGMARFAYPFGTRRDDWLHDIPKLLNP
jgi:protein SCO1/2